MDPVTLFAACTLVVHSGPSGASCGGQPFDLLGQTAPSVFAFDTPHSTGARIDRWQSFIGEASRQFAIPEPWIRAVMGLESGGRTTLGGRPITSGAGAMGLMQVMPGTYSDLRNHYTLGDDSYDPHDNILAGTAYLRQMYDRYGYPSLFAAYNAGPKRFDAYLFAGKPLPNETLSYVESILPGVGTVLEGPHGVAPNMKYRGPFLSARVKKIMPRNTLFFTLSQPENSAVTATQTTSGVSKPRANSTAILVGSSSSTHASRGGLFVPLSPRQQ
ncbi:MAG: lytic transglycosylase domain-containing protein [Alphaproteobacteria bacterium]|nr:lytic transglycosylase domain-containing protein [Alphaproteobacteria bacterium]